jgi:ABC-type polysaccharide/polyol phosphate transport system ATPase subunit
MSEIAIRAVDLAKVYRLYKKPSYKFWDAMGWLPRGGERYTEHPALNGVTFDIMKGEKVGIIGRNGAGKSTLLKLVTRAIEPTSGQLIVNGETQALLQIGTGFHPDLTGRDNVVSYLAQLGIGGRKAAELIEDIIDFAELEEYIDQPVKSYSTGMAARLMFAASTVIEPSLLVIDEILGVGDAYFARKSFERIRELCDRNDATLLLVSHDIYSSAQICNRIIWVDRGTIRFDGEPKDAINLYEASIKEQEERRLRRKALLSTGRGRIDAVRQTAIVEFRSGNGGSFAGNLFFYGLRLDGDGVTLSLDPETGSAEADGYEIALVHEGSNWLSTEEAARHDGVLLANYGSAFHKGTLRLSWPRGKPAPKLVCDLESAADQEIRLIVADEADRRYDGGTLSLKAGRRGTETLGLDISDMPALPVGDDNGNGARHGSGAVRIASIDIRDEHDNSVRMIDIHQPVSVVVGYEVQQRADLGDIEVMIAFRRDKVTDVLHVFGQDLILPEGRQTGRIRAAIGPFPLARGRYTLTVMISKAGYYASASPVFFSINPDVYDVATDAAELAVKTDMPQFNATICAMYGEWSVE